MKKDKLKGFLSGVVVTTLVLGLSLTAFAATGQSNITVGYNNIKVYVNEKLANLKDPNGNAIEPFTYNGTTYVPLRAVGEALGQNVTWDNSTKSIYIGSVPSTTTPTSTPTATPSTLGEKNALAKAKSYLKTMPFSYEGLIKQLEFEKYSTSEATYAANNCGADWNEQAAKKAKSYLKTMSFSRDSLIKQLQFEGFTDSEAEYGAKAVGY